MENSAINKPTAYAHVVIKLFQGPLYVDDKTYWRDLLSWQTPVQEYLEKIGLRLLISESDGFARVLQPETEENDENPLPRLMRKVRLSYEATLLAVMLREVLEEFDVRTEGTKLFLTQKEIKEYVELFFKEQTNKSKLWKDLSKPIGSLVNVGILKLTKEDSTNKDNNQYELKRIIKALVSNGKLEEIKIKLETNVNSIQQ